MVNVKTDALGIIFPNVYDKVVPELTNERLMASIPFGSRYRMIDFVLSGMVNSDIEDVAVVVRENYFSLLDHVGSGREWDLNRNNGGLKLYPPYSEKGLGVYKGRIDAIYALMGMLTKSTKKYVVMSDCNIVSNFDFKDMIHEHIKSGADVTICYTDEEIPVTAREAKRLDKGVWYTYDLDGDRVTNITVCDQTEGVKHFAMNIFICEREWLIETAKDAYVKGKIFFERDVLAPAVDEINIHGYHYTKYAARVSDMKSYFDENMKLLNDDNLDALFDGKQIYTKTTDDNPTRYIGDAKVKNSMIADGCVIEGTVENSIIFRDCVIEKGAVIKNSIVFSHGVIKADADIEYVIADKNVTIGEGKTLTGNADFPVFVAKGKTV